ncbi:MAG: FtsB family cell division protein [Acidimicrobiia bacterium]
MKGRGRVLAPLLILVLAGTLLVNLVPFRQIIEQRERVAEARADLDTLVEENRELQAEVVALQTPEEVERIAREKLGYVREGEISYLLVPGEGLVPEEGQPPEPEEPAWYETMWDFFTGADLAP